MSFVQEHLLTFSNSWTISVWIFAIVCIAGLIAGLMYRAGALVVLSLATFAAAVFLSLNQGWSFANSALFAFGLIVGLQFSYFAGVALTIVFSRAGAKARSEDVIDPETKQDAAR